MIDVICIGAINYDYMFHCDVEDLEITSDGDEKLSNAISSVEADIYELVGKGKKYTTQIGGSAFITLKVVKYILKDAKVAYVGACGTPNEFDLTYGKSNDIEAELSHLDNKEWLFTTEEQETDIINRTIAKSVVRLHNHSRNCIKIAPCANNTLLGRILKQEEETGKSFAEYLSGAKWIHLSSLSDFEQFERIMQYVIKAKSLNPDLKVSMDPGIEYVTVWRERLQPLVCYADYIFLNRSEKGNIGLNAECEDTLLSNLKDYFTKYNSEVSRTLIVKYEDRHDLICFDGEDTKTTTLYHKKLEDNELNNDTGAGDSLAGGVIAGMVSANMSGCIEDAIPVGVLAAKGRMISFDYENPYMNIQKLTDEYFTQK